MEYTRLFNDAGGESHFGEAEIDLELTTFAPPAPPLLLGTPIPLEQMVMCTLETGWFGDWHPSPRRQFWIQLSGEIEVEVSDGEKRRFQAGSVVLVEDTHGKGHVTRNVGNEEVRGIFAWFR